MVDWRPMQTRPLLILGAPRSGTTLLASMIGMHPEVAMLIEDLGWSITNLTGKTVVGNKLCIPNHIEMSRRAGLWERALRRLGARVPGPSSLHSIEDYLELEGLRVLAILRDGNAVISSIMKRGGLGFDEACRRWRRAVDIVHELRELHPERVAVVTYEDLVAKPEAVMRRVAAFLGLEYEPSMLEGFRSNPIYPDETSIDASRAKRHEAEGIDFVLGERFPESWERYQRLVATA